MERALTVANPTFVADYDLARRLALFVRGGPIYQQLQTAYPLIEEKAVEAQARSGGSLEDARSYMLQGIVVEALVTTGEDRSAVMRAMFEEA